MGSWSRSVEGAVRRNAWVFVLALLFALVAWPTLAHSDASSCSGGRYQVTQGIELSGFESALGVVVVAGQSVSLEPCGEATKAKVRRKRGRLFVKAAWRGCEAVPSTLRLQMRTEPGCDAARGVLRQRGARERQKFSAVRGCEWVVDCRPNYLPVDQDGDHCAETCEEITLQCANDSDCWDDSLFCGKSEGQCGGEGECRPRSEFCTEEYDPVCGCDGVTYSNDCHAASSGMNVSYAGECEACVAVTCTPGYFPVDNDGDGCAESCERAGRRCRTDQRCLEGEEFCAKRAGVCEGRGRCRDIPEVCTREYMPVCGCDGETYSNPCTAAAAGVNIADEGACP